MKYLLPLLLAVLVCTCAARADSGPVYDITGSLTIPGTSSETINFSFDVAYALSGYGTYDAYVVGGTAAITSSGPLGGPFTFFGGNAGNAAINNPSPNVFYESNYLGFFDSAGDEIDLYFGGNDGPTPGPPSVGGTYLYSCTSAACDAAFCPPSYNCTAGEKSAALLIFGTATDSAKTVPEPSPMATLLVALASLALFAKRASIARSLRLLRFSPRTVVA